MKKELRGVEERVGESGRKSWREWKKVRVEEIARECRPIMSVYIVMRKECRVEERAEE